MISSSWLSELRWLRELTVGCKVAKLNLHVDRPHAYSIVEFQHQQTNNKRATNV
jgi:hypothetical protein